MIAEGILKNTLAMAMARAISVDLCLRKTETGFLRLYEEIGKIGYEIVPDPFQDRRPGTKIIATFKVFKNDDFDLGYKVIDVSYCGTEEFGLEKAINTAIAWGK